MLTLQSPGSVAWCWPAQTSSRGACRALLVPFHHPLAPYCGLTLLLRGQAEGVGAVQPGEDKAPGWLYSSLPVPEGAYRKDGEGLFTGVCSDRTRANGCKLKEGKFRLHIRKRFFPMRVVKQWPRLPREAVAAPSLAVFKARLDGALSNRV